MRKRAQDVAETRARIVDATVHLHGTVGPAATTIAGIAEIAGVTRLTVYRHFPDEQALMSACTSHWMSQRTLPDPAAWGAIEDPIQRLTAALADLYRFYREGAQMLTMINRDKPTLPEAQRRWIDERDAGYRELLLKPFVARGTRRRRLRAVLGHAIAFSTWQSLCQEQGASEAEAVDLMVKLVEATRDRSGARPSLRRPGGPPPSP